MRRPRVCSIPFAKTLAVAAVVAGAGCSTQQSVLIGPGGAGSDAGGGEACSPTLAGRLSFTDVDVDASVGYAERGYDGFPMLSRIDLAPIADGSSALAFQTADRQSIVVVPLDASGARAGGDTVVAQGLELAGLVAYPGGFTLLARLPDPGTPLSTDPTENGTQAAFLLGYQGAVRSFSLALTGSTSPAPSLLYSSRLSGQLAFDGVRYGAYFAARAGSGATNAGEWGDQLSYADSQGNLLDGGFTWGCSENLGNRILPASSGPFNAVCLTDGTPAPGLNWMTEGKQQHLAFEETWDGYVAGAFGSLVQVSDGSYLVIWASRGDGGVDGGVHQQAMDAPDIALLRVNADGTPAGPIVWLTDTPDVTELGVHVAPYGVDRYLLVWSAINGCQYLNGNCYGDLLGTYARLIDADGNALTSDEAINGWPPDNSGLAVFPNQDVGWAFVAERPSYTEQLTVADLPTATTVRVARFAYCP